jgi:hypothetical protein
MGGMMPTHQDMQRAAYGYMTELERWTMLLIYFMEAKLASDPDFIVLSRLIRTLHLDMARGHVWPDAIFEIIKANTED